MRRDRHPLLKRSCLVESRKFPRFTRAGIGQGRVTDNLAQDIDLLDGALHIPDADTIRMIYHLLDRDGLYVGASTALNVVAAKKLAEKLGKGSRVVTILCDGAYRYVVRCRGRFEPCFGFRGFRDSLPECSSPLVFSAPRSTGTNRDCSQRSGSSRRSSSRRSPNTFKSMSCFLRRAASNRKQSPRNSCDAKYIRLAHRQFVAYVLRNPEKRLQRAHREGGREGDARTVFFVWFVVRGSNGGPTQCFLSLLKRLTFAGGPALGRGGRFGFHEGP